MRRLTCLCFVMLGPVFAAGQGTSTTAGQVFDQLLRLFEWRERWRPEGLPIVKEYLGAPKVLVFWSNKAGSEVSGLCSENSRRCLAALAPSSSSVVT